MGDGILRLDNEGNELWSWDLFSVADPLTDENIMKTKQDWSHANALNVTRDGNYIISFHHFDQFWKINSKTGELMWKLGKGGDFEMTPDEVFYKQHAVHEISKNEFLIFDNGALERKTSRALKLKIDENNLKVVSSSAVFLPDSIFSFKQGSVYEIDDKKLLFCSATKNKIAVVDESGDILWQANSDVSHYRAYYIEKLPEQFKQ